MHTGIDPNTLRSFFLGQFTSAGETVAMVLTTCRDEEQEPQILQDTALVHEHQVHASVCQVGIPR